MVLGATPLTFGATSMMLDATPLTLNATPLTLDATPVTPNVVHYQSFLFLLYMNFTYSFLETYAFHSLISCYIYLFSHWVRDFVDLR